MKAYFYLLLLTGIISSFSACQNELPKEKAEFQDTEIAKKEEPNSPELDSLFKEINQAIINDINNPELYIKRAQLYDSINDTKAAFEDLDIAFRLDTTRLNTAIAQSEFLSKRGKIDLALNILEKVKLFHPKSSKLFEQKAKLYLIGQNNEESLKNADLAVKYDKFNDQAYYIKGYNFLEMGDTAKAISSYQTAIEQNPDHFEAYLDLGFIFSTKNDPLALDYLKNALLVKPSEKRALYAKGMYEQEHELYNEAMQTYTDLVKAHPNFREAYHNLGYIHLAYLRLFQQATIHFTEAIKVDPNYIEAYYNRGYSFELMGDINNAAKDYRKALSLSPNYELAAKGLTRVTEEI